MNKYAANTSVSEEKSKSDLEKMLIRYGAEGFGYMWRDGSAAVMFEFKGYSIKIKVTLPNRNDKRFTLTDTGRERSEAQAQKAFEQASRQIWRVLIMMIQAKFEAILMGTTTFEHEFMSYIMIDDKRTVGDEMIPRIKNARDTDKIPLLLPAFDDKE